MLPLRLRRVALLLSAVVAPSVGAAQGPTVFETSLRAQAGRRELTALVDSLERESTRPGVSEKRRRALQADVQTQRERLATGDIAPGDRILLRVIQEATRLDTLGLRPDTVVVAADGTIRVAGVPPISLRGVLHAEVESTVSAQITAVIRSARVTAVPLLSIGVTGAVARPGYFYVPFTGSIADALMAAGGFAADANPNGLIMQRGGRDLWDRATMTAAAQRQVTLGSLGAMSGDVLVVRKVTAPLDRNFVLAALAFLAQGALVVTQLDRE